MLRGVLPFICVAVALCLGGCSAVVKRPSAKEYYEKAEKAYLEEDYDIATDNFRDLLDQYPLNPYAEEAQLKIAYSYYLDEEYTEALAAFDDFERGYPTSPHLPFVEYYRGMSNLEQMRSADRDQSVTQKAYSHFQTLLERYPDSMFTALAEEKSRFCRETMGTSQLQIARFYHRLNHLFAARVRLRAVIEQYPETEATTQALSSLEEVLISDDEPELAALAAKAYAFRSSTAPSKEQIAQLEQVGELAEEGESMTDLPAPSVDPLLLLVTELRKEEEKIRAQALEDRRKQVQAVSEAREKAYREAEERREQGLDQPQSVGWGITNWLPWNGSAPPDDEEEDEYPEEDEELMLKLREWMPDWIPL